MANKQLINGKVYDWSSVTITASGMENMEPMEISYDDEQESEPIYGRGGKIRGSSSPRDIRTSTSMLSRRL